MNTTTDTIQKFGTKSTTDAVQSALNPPLTLSKASIHPRHHRKHPRPRSHLRLGAKVPAVLALRELRAQLRDLLRRLPLEALAYEARLRARGPPEAQALFNGARII